MHANLKVMAGGAKSRILVFSAGDFSANERMMTRFIERSWKRLMEALQIAELADRLRLGGDDFPSDIGPKGYPKAKLQMFQNTYFNYAGDLFDQNGVMETSFPSAAAYNSRDVGRYQRRFDRREENCVRFDRAYLWITDQYSHFYYHWFCDALPRLAAALASETMHGQTIAVTPSCLRQAICSRQPEILARD